MEENNISRKKIMEENKRWIVTYTKHLRQKRKVYQDGMIELHGPSNKVLLYDDAQKLLDSRILKKDELIQCGATIAFESHLVDVGELDETYKVLQDMPACDSQGKSTIRVERVQKSEGVFRVNPLKKSHQDVDRSANISPNLVKEKEREWDVLYTSQVTQKAKRYHDGILKLVASGSHMAQLILLKEDGSTLSSKFHKSSGCLIVGDTYEMPNYLVEICGQRNVLEALNALEKNCSRQITALDALEKNCSRQITALDAVEKNCGRQVMALKSQKRTHDRSPSNRLNVHKKGWSHKITGSENKIPSMQAMKSKASTTSTKAEVHVNNLRDAFQILSVLKKPPKETSAKDLVHFSSQHSNVTESLHRNCQEETPKGSSSASSAAVCEDDSFKTPVSDGEIKCAEQDTLDLKASQVSPAALHPESPEPQAKGSSEHESGLLHEAGLHGEILGVQGQGNNSDKISSDIEEREEAQPCETDSSFPSFDLGF